MPKDARRGKLPLSQLTHGAQYAYRRGCRCLACRRWKAEDVARYRARKGRSDPQRDRRWGQGTVGRAPGGPFLDPNTVAVERGAG
ncbi:MAG: hypothetical protein AAF682_19685 [Planctomycetota bacterium]